MGQINTNNYPTVSSLADADLLIVENAIHGTGTTTPKQLRENAIGTDTLETTAQTVTGAINELKNEMTSAGHTLAGVGHKTAYDSASYTIDSDIILHRAPKGMDRVLLFLDERITRPLNLTIYGESYSDEYTIPLSINSSVWEPPAYMDGICILEYHEFEEDFALIAMYEAVTSSNGVVPISKGGTGNSYGYIRTGRATGSNVGYGATIEGVDNTASNSYAHAGGQSVVAEGLHSFAHGQYVNAGSAQQTAFGRYNDNKAANLFEIGNGTADNARSNALEVTADGHVLDGNGNDLQSVAALEQSASGNPIVVNAQGIDAKELSVELEPIQDLHGYDKPWAGGAGKNKFDITEISDVGNSYKTKEFTLKANVTYTISTDLPKNNNNSANLFFYLPSASPDTSVNGVWSGQTRTLTTGADGKFIIGYRTTDYTDPSAEWYLSHKIQIEEGSTATSYAPYSNICPISGRTKTSVLDHGKNFIPMTVVGIKAVNTTGTWNGNIYTLNNVSYELLTDNGDNVIGIKATTGSGGASAVTTLKLSADFRITKGSYVVSGCPATGSGSTYGLDGAYFKSDGAEQYSNDYGSGSNVNMTADYADARLVVVVRSGYSTPTSGLIFKPMLRKSTASANFEPYKSSSVTIQLGQTVYGGTLNVTTGVLTVTDVHIDMGSLSWAYDSTFYAYPDGITECTQTNIASDIMCSCYEVKNSGYSGTYPNDDNIIYRGTSATLKMVRVKATVYNGDTTAFKTGVTGQDLIYKLATPTTIQLTPSMLKLLKGYNYITADGDMQLVYIPESVLPTAPTTDGNYKLRCTVSNGVPSFSWVSDT